MGCIVFQAPSVWAALLLGCQEPETFGGCFYGFVNCFFGIGPFDSGMLAQTPAAGLFFGDSAED